MTEWIVAVCAVVTLLLIIGGIAVSIRVAQTGNAGDIKALKENDERQEKEIESLRDSRHEHGEWLHEHQIKIEQLEKHRK